MAALLSDLLLTETQEKTLISDVSTVQDKKIQFIFAVNTINTVNRRAYWATKRENIIYGSHKQHSFKDIVKKRQTKKPI